MLTDQKGDIILVRLVGEKPEYTGVVAGMSGSPVYLDGKLAGALAFRIGEFSKEPIAGVTPIAEMLEINALDQTPTDTTVPPNQSARAKQLLPEPTSGLGESCELFKPIEAPLVFSGFSEQALQLFAPQFARCGNRSSDGHRFGQRRETARASGARFSRQRDPGPRRHGYRRNLHRDLHGRRPSAGLRPSAFTVRSDRIADDQGASARDTCLRR